MGDVLHLFTNTGATRCAACDNVFVAPVTIIYVNGKAFHQGGCPPHRCCVPGCTHSRLLSSPCCYGHVVDADDPRHIPSENDGSRAGSGGVLDDPEIMSRPPHGFDGSDG